MMMASTNWIILIATKPEGKRGKCSRPAGRAVEY
jgi:hypothetical protein